LQILVKEMTVDKMTVDNPMRPHNLEYHSLRRCMRNQSSSTKKMYQIISHSQSRTVKLVKIIMWSLLLIREKSKDKIQLLHNQLLLFNKKNNKSFKNQQFFRN